MPKVDSESKVIIFDTTLRDGELTPGVKMNSHQKMSIAKLLEKMRVDVIEVGYPGAFQKDFDEIYTISQQVKNATICGLASSKPEEIASVVSAIKPAARGRIHIYTPVNLKNQSLALGIASSLFLVCLIYLLVKILVLTWNGRHLMLLEANRIFCVKLWKRQLPVVQRL